MPTHPWSAGLDQVRRYAPCRTKLVSLRGRLVAFMVVYILCCGFAMVGIGSAMVRDISAWTNERAQLPAGAGAIELADVWNDRPSLWGWSTLGLVAGLLLSVGGFVALWGLLGKSRQPQWNVVSTIAGLPLFLFVAGTAFTVMRVGELTLVLAPFTLGFCLTVLMGTLWAMAVGTAHIAVNIYQDAELASEEDIPERLSAWFDKQDATLAELGLTPLGTTVGRPSGRKFRRVYGHPSQAFYVSASHVEALGTTVRCLSVSSITEDGAYFESTNLREPVVHSGSDECSLQIPDATADELISSHLANVRNWCREHDTRLMQVAEEDEMVLDRYGNILSANHRPNPFKGLDWLANPYKGLELPPVPGRPTDEAADANGVESIDPRLSVC